MSQFKSLTIRMDALEYSDLINKHAETATEVAKLSEGQLAMITSIATLTQKIDTLVSCMEKSDEAPMMPLHTPM